MRLFHLINQHTTLYEEVTGRGDGPGFEGRPAERAAASRARAPGVAPGGPGALLGAGGARAASAPLPPGRQRRAGDSGPGR